MSSNISNASKNRTDAALSNIENWSHEDFADYYYKMNKDKYIWSDKSGWYAYDENNLLISSKKDYPFTLLKNVTVYLRGFLKEEMNTIDTSNDDVYVKTHKKYLTIWKTLGTSTYTKNILPYLQPLYYIKNIDDKIDSKRELFSFNDKVFDIKEGILRDIERDDYISRTTGYNAPTKEAKISKKIDKLLFEMFEDKEICDYLLLITAMTLYTNRFEKLYILTGNGRNGKGVFINLVTEALGAYFQPGSNDLLTIKDEQKNCTLSEAKGTRFLSVSEPAEDDKGETKFNVSMIKKLTGGDAITPRGLYKDPIKYVPHFTIFVSCNRQPSIDEMNEAVKNRFRFIHFPFTFVDNPRGQFERQIDSGLKDRLSNYRDSFIMYLLYLVSQDYDKEKINEPSKCIVFKNDYFDDNNDVEIFIKKYFEITKVKEDLIKVSTAYELYMTDGDFKKISLNKFTDGMKMLNIPKVRDSTGRFYTHLKRPTPPENKVDPKFIDEGKKNPLDL